MRDHKAMRLRLPRPALCLVLLVHSVLCLVSASGESPVKLTSMQVAGSKLYAEAEIIRASGLKPGTEVSPEAFEEAANRLAASGVFSEITYRYRPASDGLAVSFQVTDTARFFPCHFSNFVWFSDDQLQAELRARVPLFHGTVPAAGTLPDQIDSVLAAVLKERGIAGNVRHQMEATLGGQVQGMQFNVEGIVIPIRRIDFQEASQVDVSLLQAAVQPLLGQDYNQSFVNEFANHMVGPVYWQRGYLRVAFLRPNAKLVDARDNSVDVSIPVREGLQYLAGEVRWSGNTVFSSADLSQALHLVAGKPVDGVQLQQDLEKVRDRYGTRGYILASLRPNPSFQDATRTVSYDVHVTEGDLYRMGKLEIAGLDASHTEALSRRWTLPAGDPYDRSYLKTFLGASGRHLPKLPQGWNISLKELPNNPTKTVDVTVTFAPRTGS
ncbi:MAG TPA: POTRA domain-containing protein [Terriglobia bacterium]|nr:POTRA domain-containing protein [Terriglobia bacterium]